MMHSIFSRCARLLAHARCCSLAACGLLSARADAQPRVLDSMDDASSWKIVTPEGVRLAVHKDEGVVGDSLRLDYEFVTGGGYCIIQKDFPLSLPANYEFAFHVRGEGADNNLEFKLLDKAGDSVWWVNRRAYEWPKEWTRLSNKKRKLEFAWGPSAGAPLTEISKIEFAIASSGGGKGSVWLDELTLRELATAAPVEPQPLLFSATSHEDDAHAPVHAGDGDKLTTWSPADGDSSPSLTLDLGSMREFGAIDVRWDVRAIPGAFGLSASDDGFEWRNLARRDRAFEAISVPSEEIGAASLIVTPDEEARFIRLDVTRDRATDGSAKPVRVREVKIRDAEFGASRNAMVEHLASEFPRGQFPKYFSREASFWTVVGAPDATSEALINEEGQIEVGKRGFMIDPMVHVSGHVYSWGDAEHFQSLADDRLPLPRVVRTFSLSDDAARLRLTISPFVDVIDGASWLVVRYTLRCDAGNPEQSWLTLALRPYQVNPTYQYLNAPGGVSNVRAVQPLADPHAEGAPIRGLHLLVGRQGVDVLALTPADATRARMFNFTDLHAVGQSIGLSSLVGFDVTEPLEDASGLASGQCVFTTGGIAPLDERVWIVCAPLDAGADLSAQTLEAMRRDPREWERSAREAVVERWREATSRASIIVPSADSWLSETFAAQQAYILINRDGPALQPGSRSYERSWARDGSMTSAALIACGFEREAREWIDWFCSHQFENGKIPCVVDSRGPDPVNEHDSTGEYIWAVANYHRHTRDAEFLARHWPRVRTGVEYLQSLRAQRMTDEYRLSEDPTKRAMYGLVPESISHEGYSSKPMHSYWDDFFTLLGFKEASYVAEQAGDEEFAQAYAKLAADFRACLSDSIRRVGERTGIDFIPGCVELADFDSTSTTIALFPCAEQHHLPQPLLSNTFDRYWAFAQRRMKGEEQWEAFTPYELRHVGAFVRMGQRDRAFELLRWFRQLQRPQGWHHWAEVVWNDPQTPKFIGDMPHTWVGSDFLNSVISMFVYEDQGTLVLFGGVPSEWAHSTQPIGMDGVRTPFGTLSMRLRYDDDEAVARIEGDARIPEQGFLIKKPPGARGTDMLVSALPAELRWEAPR